MPKNKSLVRQFKEALQQKLRIGEGRHTAKQEGVASEGIYSWGTYNDYRTKCSAFVKWVKTRHAIGGNGDGISNGDSDGNKDSNNFAAKIRTLADCRPYIDDYLRHYIENGYSPYTQKAIACALAKLYGCSTKDFIPTQVRRRENITRSRKGKANAKFSEANNQEFVDFCKSVGLRRAGIKMLKPEHLHYDEKSGQYFIAGLKGKGGRLLNNPILSQEAIERIQNTPAGQKVWEKIPANPDIHSYRADYCRSIYERHARPIAEIPKHERYYCRNDLKGVVYDRRAMAIASRALGHNRISVIAGHYLYAK